MFILGINIDENRKQKMIKRGWKIKETDFLQKFIYPTMTKKTIDHSIKQ